MRLRNTRAWRRWLPGAAAVVAMGTTWIDENALQRYALLRLTGAVAESTGASLRVATFNTQLYSPGMKPDWRHKLFLFDDRTEEQAQKIAARILDRAGEWDVVALQEVWDEDAKDVLVERLAPVFRHYVRKIDVHRKGWHLVPHALEDSGLMLFSRLPFAPLPCPEYLLPGVEGTTDQVAFVPFSARSAIDRLAAKGAALVRVVNPADGTSCAVVLTHMQADASDAAAMRERQLADIERLIERTIGDAFEGDLLVLGDLNIDGAQRAGASPSEWVRHFATRTSYWVRALYDAWAYTTSPDDPGRTSDQGERLDYVLHGRLRAAMDLVPRSARWCVQHIALTLRGLSDHVGVVADLNRGGAHSSPRTARVLGRAGTEWNDRWYGSTLAVPGSVEWYRLDVAGTYTLRVQGASPSLPVAIDVYRADDLSTPLAPWRGDSREVATGGQQCRAERFHLPEPPYYVKVSNPDRRFFGRYRLHVHRHGGATRDDAIVLGSNEPPVDAGVAAGEARWFVLDLDRALSGRPQQVEIAAEPQGSAAELELRNARDELLARAAGDRRLVLLREEALAERRWLRVEGRARVAWTTDLTWLHGAGQPGARELELICDDETGSDFFGDDEIDLHLEIDGVARTVHIADCNVGGYYFLDQLLGEVAFVDRLRIWLEEVDARKSQKGPAIEILPLARGQSRSLRETNELGVDGGRYRLRFNRSSTLGR